VRYFFVHSLVVGSPGPLGTPGTLSMRLLLFAWALALLLSFTSASAQSIKNSALVESDGARLFLEIRGADSAAAVVLFVHGGPGDHYSALLPFMAYSSPQPGYAQYGGPKQWALFEESTHVPFVDASERLVTVVRRFLQEP
jgi:hypothetical protein